MSVGKFKRFLKIRKTFANRPSLKKVSTTNHPQPLLIHAEGNRMMSPYPTIPRNSQHKINNTETPQKVIYKDIGPLGALEEFFTHPLTWERNNAYLNALIGILVLSFWFTSNNYHETIENKDVSQMHSFEEQQIEQEIPE